MTVPKPMLQKNMSAKESPEERKKREQPMVQGSSLSGGTSSPNDSPYGMRFAKFPMEKTMTLSSGSKSHGGMAFTLASKINMALSRVMTNTTNGNLVGEDDDLQDLM